jgi:GNAT superfamily N-acetyltransferase
VGALIGVMEQQLFSEAWVATVMHIDVLPEARMGGYAVRLIRAFEQWAKNRNAFEINLATGSGVAVEKVSGFVEKLGFVPVGKNFAKDVK